MKYATEALKNKHFTLNKNTGRESKKVGSRPVLSFLLFPCNTLNHGLGSIYSPLFCTFCLTNDRIMAIIR